MARSFIIRPESRNPPPAVRRRVFVTGASGRIGSQFAEVSHQLYELTLMVLPEDDAASIEDYGKVVRCELSELEKLKELLAGQDTVVHLAADPSPTATWESMLPNNIVGTYTLMTAAVAAGCRRVVYASSIHAVSGYEQGYQVHTDDPVNPGDLYGVTKCFGEAMARFIATQHGVSAIAIRIGAFQPLEAAREPENLAMMNAFISHGDLIQLIQCCIDNEDLLFAIVHGLSNNLCNCMEIETAKELLGYKPEDDFTDEHPALADLDLTEKITPHSKTGGNPSGLQDQVSDT